MRHADHLLRLRTDLRRAETVTKMKKKHFRKILIRQPVESLPERHQIEVCKRKSVCKSEDKFIDSNGNQTSCSTGLHLLVYGREFSSEGRSVP